MERSQLDGHWEVWQFPQSKGVVPTGVVGPRKGYVLSEETSKAFLHARWQELEERMRRMQWGRVGIMKGRSPERRGEGLTWTHGPLESYPSVSVLFLSLSKGLGLDVKNTDLNTHTHTEFGPILWEKKKTPMVSLLTRVFHS